MVDDMIKNEIRLLIQLMKKNSTIFVAGHKGLVGSAVLRKLKILGYKKIVTASRNQLNLLDQKKTFDF